MSKVRVVYKPDKSVSIIHHAPKSRLSYEQAMEKAMIGVLAGLPYDDIDDGSLPSEREYRNAWEGEKGKSITVNADKKAAIDAAKIISTEKDRLIKLLDDPDVVQKLKDKTKAQA